MSNQQINSREERPSLLDMLVGTFKRIRISQKDYSKRISEMSTYEQGDVWYSLVQETYELRRQKKAEKEKIQKRESYFGEFS